MLVFLVLFLCCHYANRTERAFADDDLAPEATSAGSSSGDSVATAGSSSGNSATASAGSPNGNSAAAVASQELLPNVASSSEQLASSPNPTTTKKFYVTISDRDEAVTVKTSPATVQEIIEHSGIMLDPADVVEPERTTLVTGDLVIRIYRTRPVIIVDGATTRYIMTASIKLEQIVEDAGLALRTGDQVVPEFNYNFMEKGVAKTYRIIRAEQPQPADVSEPAGISEPTDVSESANVSGSTGISAPAEAFEPTDVSEPADVPEPASAPQPVSTTDFIVPEGQETCAEWIRAAGVAESDLEPALELIYHESHCRVDATNPSSGAYGIPQALPATRLAEAGDDWQTNPVTQIRWMANYVERRYGGWHEALAYWQCLGLCTSNLGTITKYNYWY